MKTRNQKAQATCHDRRQILLAAVATATTTMALSAGSPEPVSVKSTDITGAEFAKDAAMAA